MGRETARQEGVRRDWAKTEAHLASARRALDAGALEGAARDLSSAVFGAIGAVLADEHLPMVRPPRLWRHFRRHCVLGGRLDDEWNGVGAILAEGFEASPALVERPVLEERWTLCARFLQAVRPPFLAFPIRTRPAIPRPAPLRLDEGVMLEPDDILIPWGATTDDITKYGSPTLLGLDRSTFSYSRRLAWEERRCLGGLRCTLTAELSAYFTGKKPDTLRSIWIHALGFDIRTNAHVYHEYRTVQEHLEQVLGAPDDATPVWGLPYATWYYASVDVAHYVFPANGGEVCSLYVSST